MAIDKDLSLLIIQIFKYLCRLPEWRILVAEFYGAFSADRNSPANSAPASYSNSHVIRIRCVPGCQQSTVPTVVVIFSPHFRHQPMV